MHRRIRDLIERLYKKTKKGGNPKNTNTQRNQSESKGDPTTALSVPASASRPSTPNTNSKEPTGPKDLWQTAYYQLDKNQQHVLSTVEIIFRSNNNSSSNPPPTTQLLDDIIQTTREKYEENQAGGLKIRESKGEYIDIRNVAERIINAALTFKNIVGAVAAFDPYASSAWAIVSLGLTMTKNRYDLQDALFSSSQYLADVLARCACIEKHFYHDEPSQIKTELRNAIIRTYRAILNYAAEVWSAQNPSKGRLVLDVVTPITDQPLTNLKCCVVEQQQYLHQWVEMGQYIERRNDAKSMLASLQNLMDDSILSKLPSLDDAAFDSYMDQNESQCLDGTRTELLEEVEEWGCSPESQCIFWLNGMAGTGKSTISRTMAARFQEKAMLGASFFFKKGAGDRGNAKQLFTTITTQLVTRVPQIIPSIKRAVNNDPGISAKSLNEQFKQLLLQPLLDLKESNRQNPLMVVIIDALDECERENDVRILLQLLPQVTQVKSIRLRFFLTSRPELPTELGFRKVNNEHRRDLLLHEIPESIIKHDISLFLEHRFTNIREDRSFSSDWPGDDKIQALVKISVPLFIFAATVCRFVEDLAWSAEERLEDFLRDPATTSASEMDRTYLPILKQLTGRNQIDSKRLMQEFHEIIGAVILLATPLSVNALAQLLGIRKNVISNRLGSFRSILSVPNDPDVPVRTLHLSFRDFLLNTTSDFHVDEEETHWKIASQCLRIMSSFLKHNICDLPSYGTERTAIESETVDRCLSAELQYSCRYWVYHLEQGKDHITGTDNVLLFLESHFLHWLEAMSVMGIVSEAVGTLDTLQSTMKDKADSKIMDFLHDARRFILKNVHIADIAPLQLYCSGLIFAPAIVRGEFEKELPSWIHILPKVDESWSAGLQTLEGHSDGVNSVVISPDGHLIASGSSDKTVRLWDATTGDLQQILEGHSGSIQSVAISPNSYSVASSSDDKTVRLWDTTGALQHILKGHSESIKSLAFSPNGCLVASGSDDNTIKLWDVITGVLQHTLEGHSDSCHSSQSDSVVFSPDSLLVSSCSLDNVVRLWDTTGVLRHILEGHSDSIHSVAFSPNSCLIASGSYDTTIRIWNTATGALQHIFEGHSHSIQSVIFSPNGCLVASGSYDDTIRVWNTATGALQHILEGHSHSVESVVFSPNGHLIASGSDDNTVRLWDAATGTPQQTLNGHLYQVASVVFSPDSCLVASCSYDKTIKLWDATTRASVPQQTSEDHSELVSSVAFSPDGHIVASGSYDNTVGLWDTTTGVLRQTLRGHLEQVELVAFSPNNCLVASCSLDTTIRLWDVATGALKQILEGHSDWAHSLLFSPDSHLVVSYSYDNTVRIWDAATGALKQTLYDDGIVMNLNFSGLSQYLDTDWSSPDIQPYDDCTIVSSQANTKLSLKDEWITVNGEKVLWLPFEYRDINCGAVKDGTVAWGYDSGRVSIIGFCSCPEADSSSRD